LAARTAVGGENGKPAVAFIAITPSPLIELLEQRLLTNIDAAWSERDQIEQILRDPVNPADP
jgi:hypothetical protein